MIELDESSHSSSLSGVGSVDGQLAELPRSGVLDAGSVMMGYVVGRIAYGLSVMDGWGGKGGWK